MFRALSELNILDMKEKSITPLLTIKPIKASHERTINTTRTCSVFEFVFIFIGMLLKSWMQRNKKIIEKQ